VLTGCGGPSPRDAGDTGDVRDAATDAFRLYWPCPFDWVESSRGGCGPAIVLCAPGGEARAGACTGIDVSRARNIPLADGGTAESLVRDARGVVRGAWHEAGSVGGAPSRDWVPDGGVRSSDGTWRPVSGIPSCATGWMRATDGSCSPTFRADCPTGAFALPNGACTPTDDSVCAPTEYADPGASAVGATVLHVREGSNPATADGSIALPFASIEAAVTRAVGRTFVLVAAGTYVETLDIVGDLTILGRCANRTSLVARAGRTAVTARTPMAQATVRDVLVRGDGPSVTATDGARMQLDRVRIESPLGAAISSVGAGSVVSGRDIVVRDARNDRPGLPYGDAVFSSRGGVVDLQSVVLQGSVRYGLRTSDAASRLTVRDGVVQGVRASSGAALAVAMFGGTVTLARVAVIGNEGSAISLNGADSALDAEDVLIADTRSAGGSGEGLIVQNGGRAEVRRSAVLRSIGYGVIVGTRSSSLRLTDSIVGDTRFRGANDEAAGVSVNGNATLVASGVQIVDNAGAGLSAQGIGHVQLSNCVVSGSRGRPGRTEGQGMFLSLGVVFEGSRVALDDNTNFSVIAFEPGTSVSLTDSWVRGTRRGMGDPPGASIAADSGATMDLARVRIEAGEDCAVLGVHATTRLQARDVVVVPSARATATPSNSGGVCASLGATVTLERTLVRAGRPLGVVSIADGTRVEMVDSVVEDSAAVTSADGFVYGAGIIALNGGSVGVRRTLVARSELFGLWSVQPHSSIVFSDGAVVETHADARFGNSDSVLADHGGNVTLERTLIAHGQVAGVTAFDATATLRDVWIDDVRPGALGAGIGLVAMAGGTLDGSQVAVTETNGTAIASIPHESPGSPLHAGSSMSLADVFVQRVRTSTVGIQYDGGHPGPTGRTVAYGLYAGGNCRLTARRALVDSGGFGVASVDGVLDVDVAVISRQLDSAAAASSPSALRLGTITYADNARDDVVIDSSLPRSAALAPPTAVCPVPPCE